jgi:hypothetical protein
VAAAGLGDNLATIFNCVSQQLSGRITTCGAAGDYGPITVTPSPITTPPTTPR